jgi:hypothetical protein
MSIELENIAETNAKRNYGIIYNIRSDYAITTLKMVIHAKETSQEYSTTMFIEGKLCKGHLLGSELMPTTVEYLRSLLKHST